MKRYIWFIIILSFSILNSCSNTTAYDKPTIEPKKVQNDFRTWWDYHTENITLSADFIAVDESSKVIDKAQFLKKLTTGNFIPLRLQAKDSLPYYQLFELGKTADEDIKNTIRNTSLTIYKYYKLEGEPFPDFRFEDLKGNIYNTSNTKNKIIILKCWFISCKPCVAEIPALNQLVKQHEGRDDILFISLAIDPAKDLERFLSKRAFNYAIIPNQQEFMSEVLNVGQFPTHFIINKQGVIEKVVSRYEELVLAMEGNEQITKKSSAPANSLSLLPPPIQ